MTAEYFPWPKLARQLWREGFDTKEIAQQLDLGDWVSEAEVYNYIFGRHFRHAAAKQ